MAIDFSYVYPLRCGWIYQPTSWNMWQNNGFSFLEVLISLLIVSTVSFALLKQCWRVNQSVNNAHAQYNASLSDGNDHERLLFS